MKKVLTRKELEKIDGGVALGPLIWFKLLPLPKGSKSKNPSGLVVL